MEGGVGGEARGRNKKETEEDHSKTKASKSGKERRGEEAREPGRGRGREAATRGPGRQDAVSGGLDLWVAFARKKMDVKSMLFGHLLGVDGTRIWGRRRRREGENGERDGIS